VEEAVSNAAYACKEGKKENQTKCKIFSKKMLTEYKRQMSFIKELRGAIENRELQVFIQPKILADGESVAGGEALIRWIKPDQEMIYPGEFIPPFEKSGAIMDVDFFVFREVFAYLRRRLDQNLPVVPISMNVSRVHINNDRMIDYIQELFAEYQIDPKLVEFELTESIYIENLEKAVTLISKLRAMGAKVSMDDFGSGYSSLNMLSNMPMDIMKIDRIFLKGNTPNPSDKIILNSIVFMGRELDMCMVCEGVETKEQYEFLKGIGCDIMQGYYFGRPMPLDEFDKFLGGHQIRHFVKRERGQAI
jgi:EAL domain-containing protein (putative c-di-GMP-specific phosphodiesterase class I)